MNERTTAPHIVGLHTGGPVEYVDDEGRAWTSSIGKTMRSSPISVGPRGLEGDAPADTENHGGPDRAACVCPRVNLEHWAAMFDRDDITSGAFGENLTVDGIDEGQAAVGDIWIIGTARVQVSQPRSPCWKLARHIGIVDFAGAVRDSGRTGWYLRVLKGGVVRPGQRVDVVKRPFPHLTVSAVNEARWSGASAADNIELASCPALSTGWRAFFSRRLERTSVPER